MKVVALWMLAVALVRGATGDLPPPERSYNILMLLPVGSKSHRNVFMPMAEALADRGHKVRPVPASNITIGCGALICRNKSVQKHATIRVLQ